MTKRRAYILRGFNDAGTGETFTAGKEPVLLDAGVFVNFEAAGLVSAEPPEGARKASTPRRATPKLKTAAAPAPALAPTAGETQP